MVAHPPRRCAAPPSPPARTPGPPRPHPPTEIWFGHVPQRPPSAKAAERLAKGTRGTRPWRSTPDLLKRSTSPPRTRAGGSIGMLKDGGELRWGRRSLQGPDFRRGQEAVERKTFREVVPAVAVQQLGEPGPPEGRPKADLTRPQTTNPLARNRRPTWPPSQYIEAQRYPQPS